MSDDASSGEVVRMWTGWVATQDREAYARYVTETGIAQYRQTEGNLDAWLLLRNLDNDTTEVTTVSRWVSLDAIRAFVGDDVSQAVFYSEDDRYLVDRERVVRHYDRA
ncbi:MAG TPA: hypothetical protein VEQ66_03065 [Propionibacteriaceae bacterium]|nr:hypothetical protein [Propionibacteriaceae bacterium]